MASAADAAGIESRAGAHGGSQSFGWKMHPEYRGRYHHYKSMAHRRVWSGASGTYMGWRDVKVDAYWRFGATDNLTEVYVNKWKQRF
jgi:hypothetical protein